jgi:hypothetical protein
MGFGLFQSADSLRNRGKSGVLLEVVIIKKSVNFDYLTLPDGKIVVAIFEIETTMPNVFNPNFNLRSLMNIWTFVKINPHIL